MLHINKIIGSILLVSSLTMGGGILALPTNTVASGFILTSINFLICWFFMTCGALYLLEVTLWDNKETNLISMAKHTLGVPGQLISWSSYILLLYALLCAYLKASTAWLVFLITKNIGIATNFNTVLPIFISLIGIIILLGTAAADHLNRLLSIGLFITYAILIIIAAPNVDINTIRNLGDITAIPTTVPLIITTFGFAIIVPSLAHYLQQNVKKLIYVIIIGSIIPLLIYIIWEYVTLGTLSIPGSNGLIDLAKQRADGTQVGLALGNVLGNPYLSIAAKAFSLFAILTSLIGVALCLFHFLADGLQMSQRGWAGIKLFVLTFTPPAIIVLFYPAGFDKILSFGGIFVAIILGLLPVTMTWAGRYNLKHEHKFRVPGGKPLLSITGLFFFYVILQELINTFASK